MLCAIYEPLIFVLGLQWLDDEQAMRRFGTKRFVTFMDGTMVETKVVEAKTGVNSSFVKYGH
jgi:hypothetical protein